MALNYVAQYYSPKKKKPVGFQDLTKAIAGEQPPVLPAKPAFTSAALPVVPKPTQLPAPQQPNIMPSRPGVLPTSAPNVAPPASVNATQQNELKRLANSLAATTNPAQKAAIQAQIAMLQGTQPNVALPPPQGRPGYIGSADPVNIAPPAPGTGAGTGGIPLTAQEQAEGKQLRDKQLQSQLGGQALTPQEQARLNELATKSGSSGQQSLGVPPAGAGTGGEVVDETGQSIQGTDGKPVVPPGGEAQGAPPPINFRDYFTQGLTSGSPQALDSQLLKDEQFYNTPPEGVDPAFWNQHVKSEMDTYKAELQKYPDQFDKITANHNTRMQEIAGKWSRTSSYEQDMQRILDEAGKPKEPGYDIQDPESVQKNENLRKALDEIKAGGKVEDVLAKYKGLLPESYNFGVGKGGEISKGNLSDYQNIEMPDITRSGDVNAPQIDQTDLQKILSGTPAANEAEQLRLDALKQQLKAGGAFSQEELEGLLRPGEEASRRSQESEMSSTLGRLSAAGYGTSARPVVGAISDIGTKYQNQRDQARAGLTRENLLSAVQGRQEATRQLGDLTKTGREAAIEAARLGSTEKISQAELEQRNQQLSLAKDTLYQEGQLTQSGQQLTQALQSYGLALDKYKTDQGFDLDKAKLDLQERIANQTGNMEAAKLQADNVFKSIDAAQNEVKIDNQRNQFVADLELRAAQGDQESSFKVQSLRTEQDLRQQGLNNDMAQFVGNLEYQIVSGREKLDQDMKQFLMALDAQIKASNKGGGIGGFLGKLIGGAVGAFAGGVGAAVGAKIGGKIAGG
jgi:hypothetical protein